MVQTEGGCRTGHGGRSTSASRRREFAQQLLRICVGQGRDVGHDGPFDLVRESGHRGIVEQGPQRQFHAEEVRQMGVQLGGEKGVAAEEEEVLVDPYRLQSEQFGDESRHRALGLVARGDGS